MKNELVKVDHNEYGLEETKANEIASQFKPMLDKMVELENEYNEIVSLPIEDSNTAIKAKELRLKYVKVRTGTDKIHKAQKAFYLAGGRFVDGWKNAQLFASQGKEEKLMDIEKYQERLEAERIEKLSQDRINEIEKYLHPESSKPIDLGYMPDDVWENYLLGAKASYNARIEAEKKAEEERIAAEKKAEEDRLEKERKEKLHNERKESILPYWNFIPIDKRDIDFSTLDESEWKERFEYSVKLKNEDDKKKAEIAAENERLKKEAELKAKKEKEEQLERERLAKLEAEKQAKIKAELEAKAEVERQAKIKLENELKAKVEAEKKEAERLAKLEAEKKEAEKLASLAPEKEKIQKWIDSFNINEIDIDNISESGKSTINIIKEKFNAFKKWAESQKEIIK